MNKNDYLLLILLTSEILVPTDSEAQKVASRAVSVVKPRLTAGLHGRERAIRAMKSGVFSTSKFGLAPACKTTIPKTRLAATVK